MMSVFASVVLMLLEAMYCTRCSRHPHLVVRAIDKVSEWAAEASPSYPDCALKQPTYVYEHINTLAALKKIKIRRAATSSNGGHLQQ